MKTDEHFREAAKLYAANIEMVEQMKAVYEEELTAFVDKVVDRVRSLIHPAKLCFTSRQKWVSLWIGEDCEKEDKEQGGIDLGFTIRQPDIIRRDRLDVTIYPGGLQQGLAAHPDFTPVSKRGGNFFVVQIDLSSGDGVEVAAVRLVKMLQAIDASYPAGST